MPDPSERKYLRLENPKSYRIRAQGILQESYCDSLGDVRITVSNRKGESLVTALVGLVKDQDELMGIVNSLYELHLPLLSVLIIDKANEFNKGQGGSGT